MSRRTLLVVVMAAAILASGLMGVTNSEGFGHGGFPWRHGGKTRINWEVSGTIVNAQLWFIPPVPPDTEPDPPVYLPGILIDAYLKGAPGKAQFRVLAAASAEGPVIIPECLGDGSNPDGQYFAFDDMVIIFEDLSMLFAKMNPDLKGWLCFTGAPAVANMEITGGTGRYKDAGGQFQGIFGERLSAIRARSSRRQERSRGGSSGRKADTARTGIAPREPDFLA